MEFVKKLLIFLFIINIEIEAKVKVFMVIGVKLNIIVKELG